MKKLFSVFLALCILLVPLFAAAKGSVWVRLKTGDIDALLQAGQDQEGQPRLYGRWGGNALGLDGEGIIFGSDDAAMRASYKTIVQALVMQLLGLENAPDLTEQDASAFLGLIERYLSGMPEDAFLFRQTQQADGSTRTEVTIHPQKLCEYTDGFVSSLLSGSVPEVTAFVQRQREILCRLTGLPDDSTDLCAALLARWKQLELSSLLPEEYPFSMTLTGDGDIGGTWELRADLLTYGLRASAKQGHVTGQLLIDGSAYPFDLQDVLFLWDELKTAAVQAFRQEVFFRDEVSCGCRSICLETSLSKLVQAFVASLQRSVFVKGQQWSGLLKRSLPWLELAGADPGALEPSWLLSQLEAWRSRLSFADDDQLRLMDRICFRLSCAEYGMWPLQLDAEALGYWLSFSAEEESIHAVLSDRDTRLVLQGTLRPAEKVFSYARYKGSRLRERYELSAISYEDYTTLTLTDLRDEVLASGRLEDQSFSLRAEELEGKLTWSDGQLHLELLVRDDNRAYRYTADAALYEDALVLNADLNGRQLKADISSSGVEIISDFWQHSSHVYSDGTLRVTGQLTDRWDVLAYKLVISNGWIELELDLPDGRLALESDHTGLTFTYDDWLGSIRVLVEEVPSGSEDRLMYRILYMDGVNASEPVRYEWLLTATRTPQQCEFRLTSGTRLVWALTVGWSDAPMVFEGEDTCTLLEPGQLLKHLQTLPAE